MIEGLAAGDAVGARDGAGVIGGLVRVGEALDVRDGVGDAQPTSKAQRMALANIFMSSWTMHVGYARARILAPFHVN